MLNKHHMLHVLTCLQSNVQRSALNALVCCSEAESSDAHVFYGCVCWPPFASLAKSSCTRRPVRCHIVLCVPEGFPGRGGGERQARRGKKEILDLSALLAKTAVEESPVDLTGVALHVEACLVLAVNETEGLLRVYGHARVCA